MLFFALPQQLYGIPILIGQFMYVYVLFMMYRDKDGLLSYWDFKNISDISPSSTIRLKGAIFISIAAAPIGLSLSGAPNSMKPESIIDNIVVSILLLSAIFSLFILIYQSNAFDAILANKDGMLPKNVEKTRRYAWWSHVITIYSAAFCIFMIMAIRWPAAYIFAINAFMMLVIWYYYTNIPVDIFPVEKDCSDFTNYTRLLHSKLNYKPLDNEQSTVFVCKEKSKVVGGIRVVFRGDNGRLPLEQQNSKIDDTRNICEFSGLIVDDQHKKPLTGRFYFIELISSAYKWAKENNVQAFYVAAVPDVKNHYERIFFGKPIMELPYKSFRGLPLTLMMFDLGDEVVKSRLDSILD